MPDSVARCKFRCLSVTQKFSHTEVPSAHNGHAPEHDVFQYDVRLAPVYGDKKGSGQSCPENKTFYAATPCGQIEFTSVNPAIAKTFVPGQAYLIDFTPADG
jgi:hypothetical protein